jgi:hypothetical protein
MDGFHRLEFIQSQKQDGLFVTLYLYKKPFPIENPHPAAHPLESQFFMAAVGRFFNGGCERPT